MFDAPRFVGDLDLHTTSANLQITYFDSDLADRAVAEEKVQRQHTNPF
jgi:hypothetical protein